MSVVSLREIWIFIRGRNYARQAMMEAKEDLTKLQKAQEDFRRAGQFMMFSGLLQVAMIGLLAGGMYLLASRTEMGKAMLDKFNQSVARFNEVFGREHNCCSLPSNNR